MLANGVEMPLLNFGVYALSPKEAEAAVTCALAAGWRGIDTAASYLNERAVGRAIAASGLARDEIFVTTKMPIPFASEAGAARAIERSLTHLGLDRIDLYLIHQPFGDVWGAWRTITRFYEEGVIRAIGISNFEPDRVTDFALQNRMTPMVNQIEINPFCQQRRALPINQTLGIKPVAWAPFAEGKNGLFSNAVLTRIAKAHGASVAQVILAWLIEEGIPSVSKSTKPERIAENLRAAELELSAEDIIAIHGLDLGESQFFSHRDPAKVAWLVKRPLPDEEI